MDFLGDLIPNPTDVELPDIDLGSVTETGVTVEHPKDLEPASIGHTNDKERGAMQHPAGERPAQGDADQPYERYKDLSKEPFDKCFRRYPLAQPPEYDELTEIIIDGAGILRITSKNSQHLHTVNKLKKRFKVKIEPRGQEHTTPHTDI